MGLKFDIPEKLIEERKEIIRRVWKYQAVDHIPVQMWLEYNPYGYTVQDELKDGRKQLELRLYNIEKSLREIPDDYIPTLFINVGATAIDQAFGSQIHWSDNQDQFPGVLKPVIQSPEDIAGITKPGIDDTPLLMEFLTRFKYFLSETEGKIPLSGLDNNGIMGVAVDLLGAPALYTMLLDAEDELKHLLGLITDLIIEFTDRYIRLAGGFDNMSSTDFFFLWCPEGCKGHVSSDPCANYGPDLFNIYDKPFNSRVVKKYGGGLLHNCGPNPCAMEYLNHDPPLKGVNLSYKYSKNDLEMLKRHLGGKGVIYFLFDNETPEEALVEYTHVMETLAPDVIAMPIVFIHDETTDVPELYTRFRKISEAYAQRIWG